MHHISVGLSGRVHSFIHSGYFYSASSSPLLSRGAADTTRLMCRSLHAEAQQATASEGLANAKGPYVATTVEFEPSTTRTQGAEFTTEPQRPIKSYGRVYVNSTPLKFVQTVQLIRCYCREQMRSSKINVCEA